MLLHYYYNNEILSFSFLYVINTNIVINNNSRILCSDNVVKNVDFKEIKINISNKIKKNPPKT